MNDTIAAFDLLDLRVGTILQAEPFPEARKPAYKLTLDFGPEMGRRHSSAQLTVRYAAHELIGKQVIAAMNLPPKRVAGFVSEVLVLGLPDEEGAVVLVRPDCEVRNGVRLF